VAVKKRWWRGGMMPVKGICRIYVHMRACMSTMRGLYFARNCKRLAFKKQIRCNHPTTAIPAGEVCSLRGSLNNVPGHLAEELADLLLATAGSVTIEEHRPSPDSSEQPIFGNDGSNNDYSIKIWDTCTVIAHFSPDQDATSILTDAASAFDLPLSSSSTSTATSFSIEPVFQQDFEQAVRDAYQPTQITPSLWIIPTWLSHTLPDPSATNIILEPGLAFGTGDHPTTRLCLKWLSTLHWKKEGEEERGGKTVLDYGCGSGVLAVASLVMGAEKAVGTDIEPLAIIAATRNAALNNVTSAFHAYTVHGDRGDGVGTSSTISSSNGNNIVGTLTNLLDSSSSSSSSSTISSSNGNNIVGAPTNLLGSSSSNEEEHYDVVVANILQGQLQQLAPLLAGKTKPGGGVIGLSGILVSQAAEVIEVYREHGLDGFETTVDDVGGQWALVTAIKVCK
jgi:ribosomal protein L11 methyltransferase